jgi:two-component system, OmpR family, response regulator ChvI
MPAIAVVGIRQFVASVSKALEGEGYRITTHADGLIALRDFRAGPPDLAILDSRLDGLNLLRRIRRTYAQLLVLLAFGDAEADELCAFQCGADDCVRKPLSDRLLAERVKALLRRSALGNAGPAGLAGFNKRRCGDLFMDPERHTCMWKGHSIRLTKMEFLILRALASRPGIVKSRQDLMDASYREDHYIMERTIDSHIKRLRRKFRNIDPRCDPIETLYGLGYRYQDGVATSSGSVRQGSISVEAASSLQEAICA